MDGDVRRRRSPAVQDLQACSLVRPAFGKQEGRDRLQWCHCITNDEPYLDGVYDGWEDWVVDMEKFLLGPDISQ